jgi:hypothetical protein
LALDKLLPRKQYMEILEIKKEKGKPASLLYQPWRELIKSKERKSKPGRFDVKYIKKTENTVEEASCEIAKSEKSSVPESELKPEEEIKEENNKKEEKEEKTVSQKADEEMKEEGEENKSMRTDSEELKEERKKYCGIMYDQEWLAITKVLHPLMQNQHNSMSYYYNILKQDPIYHKFLNKFVRKSQYAHDFTLQQLLHLKQQVPDFPDLVNNYFL